MNAQHKPLTPCTAPDCQLSSTDNFPLCRTHRNQLPAELVRDIWKGVNKGSDTEEYRKAVHAGVEYVMRLSENEE